LIAAKTVISWDGRGFDRGRLFCCAVRRSISCRAVGRRAAIESIRPPIYFFS